eukprot:TRINITY_DN24487_c0_g1_i4.p1 TRINITY_DN24487_c0_g1~~TRINITY_DN24487_c0_g1_i4.p1  ORF type:complete len:347 (-),score=64.31 TRINITY_DN24487_c0_g1_i4:14-1054(-)
MLRSLVGSEMCIRDRYGDCHDHHGMMAATKRHCVETTCDHLPSPSELSRAWWLWPALPFLGRGVRPVGWLYAHVQQAHEIKPSSLATLRAYCSLELPQQLDEKDRAVLSCPCSRRTDMVEGCSPVWNQVFSMPVYRLDGELVLQVWEPGLVSDDLLNWVEIPLRTLMNSKPIQCSIPMSGVSERARLDIKLSLTYSRLGAFWSNYLEPVPPPLPPAPELDINTILFHAQRAQAFFLPPLFDLLAKVTHILNWEEPVLTGCIYLLFVWLCLNPESASSLMLAILGVKMLIRSPQAKFAVSYTHLRAHETPEHLVCRLLLEKKKKQLYRKYNCYYYSVYLGVKEHCNI